MCDRCLPNRPDAPTTTTRRLDIFILRTIRVFIFVKFYGRSVGIRYPELRHAVGLSHRDRNVITALPQILGKFINATYLETNVAKDIIGLAARIACRPAEEFDERAISGQQDKAVSLTACVNKFMNDFEAQQAAIKRFG